MFEQQLFNNCSQQFQQSNFLSLNNNEWWLVLKSSRAVFFLQFFFKKISIKFCYLLIAFNMTFSKGKTVENESITFAEKLRNGYNPMVDGVRWSDRYAIQLEKLWKYMPNWLAKIFVTIAVFVFASGIQGEFFLCYTVERKFKKFF